MKKKTLFALNITIVLIVTIVIGFTGCSSKVDRSEQGNRVSQDVEHVQGQPSEEGVPAPEAIKEEPKLPEAETATSSARPMTTEDDYTVSRGESLWQIAAGGNAYNDPHLWVKIWLANRGTIPNPDLIYPGQQLRIPMKDELTREEKRALRNYYGERGRGY